MRDARGLTVGGRCGSQGDPIAARGELLQAIDEDPGYGRSREVLASMA